LESVAIEKITLIAARKMAGLTQRQLADACGVSEGTVCRWERGLKDPTITQARKIGEVCGIHYDDIIFLPKVTI
jgi:DNA-binding XRE family transcriptional regulator